MIHRLVDFALKMPFIVLATAVVLVIAGLTAYSKLDIEAYPNPVPPLVEVITQPDGWSAEEAPRLGIVGHDQDPDVVQGVVLMRYGGQTGPTLDGIHQRIDYIRNNHVLPPGMDITPYYDRGNLVARAEARWAHDEAASDVRHRGRAGVNVFLRTPPARDR